MILSYSLFSPKINHSHIRTWDAFYFSDRYWVNIPAIIAIYKTILPDIQIVFYISENLRSHFLFPMMEDFQKEGLCHINIINYDYKNTEPTFWRYIPVFEKQDDVVLCRDIDSIPTINEFHSLNHFLKSSKSISTIRSHTNHNSHGTILLAGLTTIKPHQIHMIDDVSSFEYFYNSHISGMWGTDQENIISFFMKDKNWVQTNFIDFRLPSNSHSNIASPILPCEQHIIPYLETPYTDITEWSGQPVDCRFDKLNNLFQNLNNAKLITTILSIIQKNDNIKQFYTH